MLGGFNLRSALKAILSALFSTQLARQYNYNGLKGKKGLKSLNSIMQIIYSKKYRGSLPTGKRMMFRAIG